MTKVMTDKVSSYNQSCPRPICVVTVHAHARGIDNAMTAAWHCPISINPPLYGVAVSPQRYTYELIAESRVFGINFLPFEKVELIAGIGGSKGKEIDKFLKFSLTKEKSTRTEAPILQEAYAAYECRLLDHRIYGDHRWVVGEVVAVHLQEGILTPAQVLDLSKVSPVLYLGNEFYLPPNPDKMRHVDRKVYGK